MLGAAHFSLHLLPVTLKTIHQLEAYCISVRDTIFALTLHTENSIVIIDTLKWVCCLDSVGHELVCSLVQLKNWIVLNYSFFKKDFAEIIYASFGCNIFGTYSIMILSSNLRFAKVKSTSRFE